VLNDGAACGTAGSGTTQQRVAEQLPAPNMLRVLALWALPAALALDTNAVVSWADQHCSSGTSECSEFASNALKAGGESTCWDKWAPNFVNCLLYYPSASQAHYYKTKLPGPKGSVVVYYDSKGPYHVAISKGDGTCDQHNNNHCSGYCDWGTNYVIAPYGADDKMALNSTTILT